MEIASENTSTIPMMIFSAFSPRDVYKRQVGIHKRRIDEAEFQDAFRKMIDRNQETTVCFVVGSFYLAGMAKEFINQEEENVRL